MLLVLNKCVVVVALATVLVDVLLDTNHLLLAVLLPRNLTCGPKNQISHFVTTFIASHSPGAFPFPFLVLEDWMKKTIWASVLRAQLILVI